MTPFKFSLQTLMEVKEKEKEDVTGRLAKAQEHLNMLVVKLGRITDLRLKAYEEYQATATKGTTSSHLEAYNQYASALSKEIARQQSLITQAEEKLASILSELVSIHKDIKVLEKLREKQLKAYNNAAMKEIEKELEQLISFNTEFYHA